MAEYKLSVIASKEVVEKANEQLQAATFSTWQDWLCAAGASEADTATAATPIEAPTLEKQVDAPQLSLGDVTDLLKGLDGLVGPPPSGELFVAMQDEHTYCAQKA